METDTMVVASAPEAGSQLNSPPDSTGNKESPPAAQNHDPSDSELSDIEDPEDDIGDVEPDHFADDGRVPVFKPTTDQFKSFTRYMKKINQFGMKSGIVKVIPPASWKAELPRLDEAIKTIRVKEPIKQDIMGTSGTYRQANILHQRSYNLPQWRQLCEQSEHQPPAKRGERRLNQDKPPPARSTPKPRAPAQSVGSKKKAGRPFKSKAKAAKAESTAEVDTTGTPDRLPTPISPSIKPEEDVDSVRSDNDENESPVKRMGGMRGGRGGGRGGQAISVSSRRKNNRREATSKIDEAAFKDFKYELEGDEYTPKRCEELERAYWKTLTYAPPLYGADMPGTLFDDRTTTWNLGKLENILDVLGSKIPGVNTAYLYLGMWKATFAWHLEDVDLYSINYLHFGAPKQWYSISQGDARRFEAAMKTVWPTDAKACDQFLRHKTFLISPAHLQQNFNIRVNKIVCHPGEFVITFPYGYHSGYNLGYNCAEAVNFGLDSWLEYGRVAKKCDCDQAQDSVWIDVREIERKLRGEETDFEDSEDEDEEEDDEDGPTDLPTPPESSGDTKVKIKAAKKKRKRPITDNGQQSNQKRIRVRFKAPAKEPCILCPNDIPSEPLLPTEEGEKAHRMCALYIPETSIDSGDTEIITDVKYINKARLELKCNYCRSKKGACFQCSQKKCTRAYHATCAAAAGVFVEQGEIPVFGEDGTEYKEWGIEFSCRFHRAKRDKKLEATDLSENERIRTAAAALKVGDTCQMQYYRGDIFAGAVIENRTSEEMLLVDILPRGDRVEVEYKWLLIPDPADFRLQKPSANAIPMPKSFKAKESLNTSKRQADDLPRKDDPFVEGFTWFEFNTTVLPRNPYQVKIDFTKENQIWFYLGINSTEARAQFTEDLAKPRHNPKGHFLDTIAKPVMTIPRQSYAASYPMNTSNHQNALNAAVKAASRLAQPQSLNSAIRQEKPYVYKPRDDTSISYRVDPQAYRSQQNFLQRSQVPAIQFGTDPQWRSAQPSSPAMTPYNRMAASNSVTAKALYDPTASYDYASKASYNPLTKTSYNPQPKAPHNATPITYAPATTQYTPSSKPSYPATTTAHSNYPNYSTPPSGVLQPPSGVLQPPRGLLAPPAQYRPPYPAQQAKPMNPFSGRTPISTKPNPFRIYAYLQKEHNRSPLEYRSPYRPGGGFMNGYQGNLQKHLQQQFSSKASAGSTSLMSYGSAQKSYASSQAPVPTSQSSYSSNAPSNSSYGMANGMSTGQNQPALPPHQVTKQEPPNSWDRKPAPNYHPAIRTEYGKPYNPYDPPSTRPAQPATTQTQYDSHRAQYPPYHQQPQLVQKVSQVLQPPQPYQQYHSHAIPRSNHLTSSQITPTTPMQPQYQATPEYPKPVYAHQQYFQKAQSSAPVHQLQQPQAPAPAYQAQQSQACPSSSQAQYQASPTQQTQPARQVIDVPADSTSIVERMMQNLKRVAAPP